MASVKISVKSPPDQAMTTVRTAMEKRGWAIREVKLSDGVISGRTQASIVSWGEDVVVRIMPSPEGCAIEINSLPVAQFVDWGRSKENVKNLAADLSVLEVVQ